MTFDWPKIHRTYNSVIKVLRYKHIFLVGILLFLVFWKTFWAPDVLFVIFFIIFLVYGQGAAYVRKFAPFVLLLFSYEALRGVVPHITHRVHFIEMIRFDQWMFGGQLPTNTLQHWLYHGSLHWYDYYFYFMYMIHFLAPFLLALVIWKFRPSKYWQYAGALLALSYAGFITYILYPAAPPWMSAKMGLIPHIDKLSTLIWWGWGVHNIPTLYSQLNPNPVAAVPSLHAAYPTLDFLFVHKLFGRKYSLPFLIYPLSVWFGIVYMGEHYVVDVLLGILYAVTIFFASEYVLLKGWPQRSVRWLMRRRPAWMRGHHTVPALGYTKKHEG